MLILTEDDAAAIAFALRRLTSHIDVLTGNKTNTAEALKLLAEQIITTKDRDPFDGRRFTVEIELDTRRH
jgi:predicted aspartyl protease